MFSARVENPPYPRSTDHAESVFVDLSRSPGSIPSLDGWYDNPI
jgi:hypothetical protein